MIVKPVSPVAGDERDFGSEAEEVPEKFSCPPLDLCRMRSFAKKLLQPHVEKLRALVEFREEEFVQRRDDEAEEENDENGADGYVENSRHGLRRVASLKRQFEAGEEGVVIAEGRCGLAVHVAESETGRGFVFDERPDVERRHPYAGYTVIIYPLNWLKIFIYYIL